MSSMVTFTPTGAANIAGQSITGGAFKGIADQIDQSIEQAKASLSEATKKAAQDQAAAAKNKSNYDQASNALAKANAAANDPSASAEDKAKAQQDVASASSSQQSAAAAYESSRAALKNDQQVIKNLQATLQDLMEHALPSAKSLLKTAESSKTAQGQMTDAQLAEANNQFNKANDAAKAALSDGGTLTKALSQSLDQVSQALTDTAPQAGDAYQAAGTSPLRDGTKTTPDLSAKFQPGAEGSDNNENFLLGQGSNQSPIDYVRTQGGLNSDPARTGSAADAGGAGKPAAGDGPGTTGKDKSGSESSYEGGSKRSQNRDINKTAEPTDRSLPIEKDTARPNNTFNDVNQFALNLATDPPSAGGTGAAGQANPEPAPAGTQGNAAGGNDGTNGAAGPGGTAKPDRGSGANRDSGAKQTGRNAAPTAGGSQQRGDATGQASPNNSVRQLQPKHRHEDGPAPQGQAKGTPAGTSNAPAGASPPNQPTPGSGSATRQVGKNSRTSPDTTGDVPAPADNQSRGTGAAGTPGNQNQAQGQLPSGYSFDKQNEKLVVGNFAVPMTNSQMTTPFMNALGSPQTSAAAKELGNMAQNDPAAFQGALKGSESQNEKTFWANYNQTFLDQLFGQGDQNDQADDKKVKKPAQGGGKANVAKNAVVGGGGAVSGLDAGSGGVGGASSSGNTPDTASQFDGAGGTINAAVDGDTAVSPDSDLTGQEDSAVSPDGDLTGQDGAGTGTDGTGTGTGTGTSTGAGTGTGTNSLPDANASSTVGGTSDAGAASISGLTGMELVQVVLLAASQEAQQSVQDLAQEVQKATAQKNALRNQKLGVDNEISQEKTSGTFFANGSGSNTGTPDGNVNDSGSPANLNAQSASFQSQMDSIGDDNQLRFIRLQNLSQQLTATMQAASSISKALFDVEKAVIGNIGH